MSSVSSLADLVRSDNKGAPQTHLLMQILTLFVSSVSFTSLAYAMDALELGGGAAPAAQAPAHAMHRESYTRGLADADLDGVQDFADNCLNVANSDQRDSDADGYGNICDGDLNNDGNTDFLDLGEMKAVFFSNDPDADLDGGGTVDFLDLSLIKGMFFQPPGPSGMPCAGSVPCPDTLTFDWPLAGSDAADWVINNYVDVDASAGVADYTGGTKTYNDHQGVDIDVPNFRAMDNNVPVLAAAQGVVIEFGDSNPDRHLSCQGEWNYVIVGHPNGWTSTYGHLKRASVTVGVGEVVDAGDMLGVVGSSGCSTAPHVHFEVRDAQFNVISPFQAGMWNARPVYDTPLGFMDATVQDTLLSDLSEVIDPPPNLTIIPPGHFLGIGLSIAGGGPGDTLRWRVASASNTTVDEFEFAFTAVYRHSYWIISFALSPTLAPGDYTVEIYTNDQLAQSYPVTIAPYPADWQQVYHAVPAAGYQDVFNAAVADGYLPSWVDGYEVNGSTYFNAIFDKRPTGLVAAAHGQDGAAFQASFDNLTAEGYRLVHVDSYVSGGQVAYATIFRRQGGPAYAAYHGASPSQHQTFFSDLAGQGFLAVQISSVQVNGQQSYTALYDAKPLGAWVAFSNLSSAQYQTEFNTQTTAGRTLRYLNAYTLNGAPRFSAIWYTQNPAGWVARHDISSSQFQSEEATWKSAGFYTRFVTGYDNGAGVANFGAYWSD